MLHFLLVHYSLHEQRGLVDSALDCCTAVPGLIPAPGTPPTENFSRKPSAEDLLSAGRTTPAKKI